MKLDGLLGDFELSPPTRQRSARVLTHTSRDVTMEERRRHSARAAASSTPMSMARRSISVSPSSDFFLAPAMAAFRCKSCSRSARSWCNCFCSSPVLSKRMEHKGYHLSQARAI